MLKDEGEGRGALLHWLCRSRSLRRLAREAATASDTRERGPHTLRDGRGESKERGAGVGRGELESGEGWRGAERLQGKRVASYRRFLWRPRICKRSRQRGSASLMWEGVAGME